MEMWGHFGTENYTWRFGIALNPWEYCRYFLCDFLGPNSHTTVMERNKC